MVEWAVVVGRVFQVWDKNNLSLVVALVVAALCILVVVEKVLPVWDTSNLLLDVVVVE